MFEHLSRVWRLNCNIPLSSEPDLKIQMCLVPKWLTVCNQVHSTMNIPVNSKWQRKIHRKFRFFFLNPALITHHYVSNIYPAITTLKSPCDQMDKRRESTRVWVRLLLTRLLVSTPAASGVTKFGAKSVKWKLHCDGNNCSIVFMCSDEARWSAAVSERLHNFLISLPVYYCYYQSQHFEG